VEECPEEAPEAWLDDDDRPYCVTEEMYDELSSTAGGLR